MRDTCNGFFTILIDSEKYDSDIQTNPDKALDWQNILKKAREKNKVPLCGCNPCAANQLAIRRHQGSREYYFLAKYPDQGATHNPKCRFYAKDQISGVQVYTKGVIEETDDGFKIKLELGLQVKELGSAHGPVSTAGSNGVRRPRKRAMQLLGLLHFLFTLGRLNVWHPKMQGVRSWSVVARILLEEAGKVICGSDRLDEQLLVGITVDPSIERGKQNRELIKRGNDDKVRNAQQNKQRLIVVGQLQKYAMLTKDSAQLPKRLPIQQHDGLPWMNMDVEFWAIAEKRFPQAWAAWKRGERVCAIARLQYSDEPRFSGARLPKGWQVVGVALQGLSEVYIPVESSYERQVLDLLVAQKRSFEKPLRYDADIDEVFPDFLLLDTDVPQYPMEVFGRTDEKYEKRAAIKKIYYEEHFGNKWWCWKVSTGTVIPEFPIATARPE